MKIQHRFLTFPSNVPQVDTARNGSHGTAVRLSAGVVHVEEIPTSSQQPVVTGVQRDERKCLEFSATSQLCGGLSATNTSALLPITSRSRTPVTREPVKAHDTTEGHSATGDRRPLLPATSRVFLGSRAGYNWSVALAT